MCRPRLLIDRDVTVGADREGLGSPGAQRALPATPDFSPKPPRVPDPGGKGESIVD
jgi:hypothetical protein